MFVLVLATVSLLPTLAHAVWQQFGHIDRVDAAGRLHWLALIVGDLAGAYNEIGIRQWFDRRRVQLNGRTPAQLLTGHWKPDDPAPQRVRSLAHSLAGSPAT